MFPADIPRTTLFDIRNYMLDDPDVERGCLITNDWQLLPFENVSPNPVVEIRQGAETFGQMVDLLMADNLYCWAHSHPHCRAFPSTQDIKMHSLSIGMMIYSISNAEFGFYTTDDIIEMDNRLCVAIAQFMKQSWQEQGGSDRFYMSAEEMVAAIQVGSERYEDNILRMEGLLHGSNDISKEKYSVTA